MSITAQTHKVITREELKAKLDSKQNFHLWNVLTDQYYHPAKNIPGSKRAPLDRLEGLLPALNVQKNDEIVTYCASFQCSSSKQAAETLLRLGFTNVSAYEGGLADWQEGGLPFVKES
jgi:rhodanese-related sulfurtransferase